MSDLRENLLTPERRAEAAKEQAERAARHPAVKTRHPAYATFLHGQARAQAALSEASTALAADDQTAFSAAQERYAEALALQGQYAFALANSNDLVRRADYQAHAKALECLGMKLCACPAVVRRANGVDAKGEKLETQHPVEQVWDSERGKVVTFTRCRLCEVLSCRT